MEEEIENSNSSDPDKITLSETPPEDQGTVFPNSTFDFKEVTWASDVVLIIEGKRFYVSKAVLGLASPVFQRMFQSGFKEQTLEEIELPGKRCDSMLEFFRCIYPGIQKPVDFENVLQVLSLAEEYQVLHLKPICEKVLMDFLETDPSTESIYEVLQAAYLFSLRNIREKAVNAVACRPKSELDRAKLKVKIADVVLVEIFEKKCDSLEQETSQMTYEISNLKVREKKASNEAEVLKTCFQELARKEGKICTEQNWRSACGVLVKDVSVEGKNKPVCTVLNCWDKELTISVIEDAGQFWDRRLQACIKCNGNFSCQVKLQVIVLNRYGPGDNLAIWKHFEFKVKNTETYNLSLADMSDVSKTGFAGDGNLHLLLNVFMSEPVPFEI